MKDTEVQLFLFKAILFLFGMICLLTIQRFIKIFVYKKIENADDFLLFLMFIIPVGIVLYIYYCIKKKFKKESENPIKKEPNGNKNLFEM